MKPLAIALADAVIMHNDAAFPVHRIIAEAASDTLRAHFTVAAAANGTDIEFTWKTAGAKSGATFTQAGAGSEAIATRADLTDVITLTDGNPAAANDTVNVRGNLRLTSNSDFSVTQASADSYFANSVTAAPLVVFGISAGHNVFYKV